MLAGGTLGSPCLCIIYTIIKDNSDMKENTKLLQEQSVYTYLQQTLNIAIKRLYARMLGKSLEYPGDAKT